MRAEVPSDGQGGTSLPEQELRHRNPPAESPPPQGSRAETRSPKRAEGVPSRGTDPPVHLQTSPTLKPPEAARSRRPVNAVNWAQVQTLRPQRHLKPGHLGPRRSNPRRRSHDYAEERKHARAAPQSVSRFDGASCISLVVMNRSGARPHKSPRSLNHSPTDIPGRKPASDGRNMYRPAMISRIGLTHVLHQTLQGLSSAVVFPRRKEVRRSGLLPPGLRLQSESAGRRFTSRT